MDIKKTETAYFAGGCFWCITPTFKEMDGVVDVHHIHLWSIDGQNHSVTMHVVTDRDSHEIKDEIRHELQEHGIVHATLELESVGEHCHDINCHVHTKVETTHCHHHH